MPCDFGWGSLVVKFSLYVWVWFGKLWTEIRWLNKNRLYGEKAKDESWGRTTSKGLGRRGTREGDREAQGLRVKIWGRMRMGVGHECTRERRKREKQRQREGRRNRENVVIWRGWGRILRKIWKSVRSVLSCRKDMWVKPRNRSLDLAISSCHPYKNSFNGLVGRDVKLWWIKEWVVAEIKTSLNDSSLGEKREEWSKWEDVNLKK